MVSHLRIVRATQRGKDEPEGEGRHDRVHAARSPASAKARAATAPGPVRPRTKPPEVRREELMDAAERIFLSKGIAGTSVDEIVAAADVAKGTFYIHFESKEKLLLALQHRFVAG